MRRVSVKRERQVKMFVERSERVYGLYSLRQAHYQVDDRTASPTPMALPEFAIRAERACVGSSANRTRAAPVRVEFASREAQQHRGNADLLAG
jgi:hypothetical protein